jgi:hypothetical protein
MLGERTLGETSLEGQMAIEFKYKGEHPARGELVDLIELEEWLRKYLPSAIVRLNEVVYVVFEDLSCITFRVDGEAAWTILQSEEDGGTANRCVPEPYRQDGKASSIFKVEFTTYKT